MNGYSIHVVDKLKWFEEILCSDLNSWRRRHRRRQTSMFTEMVTLSESVLNCIILCTLYGTPDIICFDACNWGHSIGSCQGQDDVVSEHKFRIGFFAQLFLPINILRHRRPNGYLVVHSIRKCFRRKEKQTHPINYKSSPGVYMKVWGQIKNSHTQFIVHESEHIHSLTMSQQQLMAIV